MAGWVLLWEHLPGRQLGETDFDAQTITLDKRLRQATRRCTIAHELEHVARGPMPADPVHAAREEEVIDRAVARRLVPFHRLEDAVRWSRDPHEIAEELWVDVPTLEARIRGLHPSERAALTRLMEELHVHDGA